MSRHRTTTTEGRAGCYACFGSTPQWNGKTAMMLAARHHDSTGHQTWAEQILLVTYGRGEAEAAQGKLL